MIRLLYKKYPEFLLLFIGVFIFLSHLGVLYVNIMEARNFISAREMLTKGHWIFTTLNDLPRYEKPPLPTWLTAVSASVFGIHSIFAYRLPAALAALFLILTSYKIQLKIKIQKDIAFWSTLILSTSFYIVFSGRDGQWDIYTHSFMMAGILFFLKILQKPNNKILNACIGGLFLGACLLSKGPVSFYALFLPFLISYGIVYKINFKKNTAALLIFFLIGVLSSIWWTLLVHYYDPGAFAEIAGRESARWFTYNVRPVWYYWSFFTQSGIWTIPALLSLFYGYLKSKTHNPVAYRFYFLWTVLVVILLSIIPEKKSRYLLPVLIPLAVTTGFYVMYAIRNFRFQFSKVEKFPLYLNFIILTIVAFVGPFVLYLVLGKTLWEMKFTFLFFGLIMLLLGLLFIYGLYRKEIKLLFSLQVAMILILINFGFPLVQLINPNRNTPNIEAVKSRLSSEGIAVFEASSTLPELVWEYGSPIPLATSSEKIPTSEKEKFGILVGEAYNPDWKKNFRNYNFKLIDTLNLNPTIAKKPNVRLLREFYILSLK